VWGAGQIVAWSAGDSEFFDLVGQALVEVVELAARLLDFEPVHGFSQRACVRAPRLHALSG
jgi:hypothetical protein